MGNLSVILIVFQSFYPQSDWYIFVDYQKFVLSTESGCFLQLNAGMSAESNKVNKVELSTFFSWGIEVVIGHVNEEKNGKVYVVTVWCKICAKHKARVMGDCEERRKNMPQLSLMGQHQLQNTR